MDFDLRSNKSTTMGALPAELIGFWKTGNSTYEFRNDSRFYLFNIDLPFALLDSGNTLDHDGLRYTRIYGDPAGVPGVWIEETDPDQEWYIRTDGTHTYHWPGHEIFGEYTLTATTITTTEMRAVLSESAGVLTFDPPYNPTVMAPWSLVEPELTIAFPSGTRIYTRV